MNICPPCHGSGRIAAKPTGTPCRWCDETGELDDGTYERFWEELRSRGGAAINMGPLAVGTPPPPEPVVENEEEVVPFPGVPYGWWAA